MTTIEIIVTIFSSSVLSAGLTGLISWKIKQNEFKKTVFVNFINKRIEAYTELENLHGTLSFVIKDDDGKKYHAIYSRLQSFQMFFLNLGLALKYNTWYSTELIEILRKVNDLQEEMGGLTFDDEKIIKENIIIGKRNYIRICILKDQLSTQIKKDYSKIHITDFRKFVGETKNQRQTSKLKKEHKNL